MIPVLVAGGVMLLMVVGFGVSKLDQTRVSFEGALVLPIVHRAEVMDLSVQGVVVERRGAQGVTCADGVRVDVRVRFLVRVAPTEQGVLQVARSIGCLRAAMPETLEELFGAKFAEALKTVLVQLTFEQVFTRVQEWRDDVLKVVGEDLNGYVLDDAVVEFLEQTPREHLDEANILDSRGLVNIARLTRDSQTVAQELVRDAVSDEVKHSLALAERLGSMPPGAGPPALETLLRTVSAVLARPDLRPEVAGVSLPRVILALDALDTTTERVLLCHLNGPAGAEWVEALVQADPDVARGLLAQVESSAVLLAGARALGAPEAMAAAFDAVVSFARDGSQSLADRAAVVRAAAGVVPASNMVAMLEVARQVNALDAVKVLSNRSPGGGLSPAQGGELSEAE